MGKFKSTCEDCKASKVHDDPLRSYLIGDDTLNIHKTFVWCNACKSVEWGEVIPSLEELERELSGLDNLSDEDRFQYEQLVNKYQTFEEIISRRREDLTQRIEWRKTRQSSGRCLECGSLDIVYFERGYTNSGNSKWELDCPVCSGAMRVLSMPILSLDRRWFKYSSEGL